MPAAITGSEKLFLGPFPKPRRVQVAFSVPIEVGELAVTPEGAAEVVEAMVWPEVEGEFRRLRARPTVIAARLTGLGIGGGVLAQRARRAAAVARSRSCPGSARAARRLAHAVERVHHAEHVAAPVEVHRHQVRQVARGRARTRACGAAARS